MMRSYTNLRHPLSILTVFFTLFVSIAQARTFYIDPAAINDSKDGLTTTNAWKNVTKVIETKFQPGDTIRLKRGSSWSNQTLQILHSGTPAAPIVITSYGTLSTPAPVIRDTGIRVVGIGASHVVVESLTVTGSRKTCVVTMGKGLRNLTIRHLEIYGCSNGISVANTDTARVHNNHVHDITYTNAGTGAIGIVLDQTSHVKVTDNILRNCVGTMNGKSDGGAVELFRTNFDIEIARNRAHRTYGFLELGGLSGDTIRNLFVHRNIALETRTLTWVNLDTPMDTSNVWGIGYKGVVITHNTFSHRHSLVGSPIGANTYLTDSNQIVVSNNIVIGDSVNGFVYQGGFRRSNNIFHSKMVNLTSKKFAWALGEIETDPLLEIDTALILYKPKPGSPLLRTGAVIVPPALSSSSNPLLASLTSQTPSISDDPSFAGAIEFRAATASIIEPPAHNQARMSLLGNLLRIEFYQAAPVPASLTLVGADGRILNRTIMVLQPGMQSLELPRSPGIRTLVAAAVLEVNASRSVLVLTRHAP